MALDPVTGLPDLTSDVYQIPLNTDSIPYDDLQAETHLPRQPLLPDDIIPTTALLTGLRSDNKGEVVHTDDNHAAKVYVVNQPAPSSGGGGGGGGTVNTGRINWYPISGILTGDGGYITQRIGPIDRYFYGYSLGIWYESTNPYGDLSPKIYSLIDHNNYEFRFHTCFPRQGSGYSDQRPFYNHTFWFPRPVDLAYSGLDVTEACGVKTTNDSLASFETLIFTGPDP